MEFILLFSFLRELDFAISLQRGMNENLDMYCLALEFVEGEFVSALEKVAQKILSRPPYLGLQNGEMQRLLLELKDILHFDFIVDVGAFSVRTREALDMMADDVLYISSTAEVMVFDGTGEAVFAPEMPADLAFLLDEELFQPQQPSFSAASVTGGAASLAPCSSSTTEPAVSNSAFPSTAEGVKTSSVVSPLRSTLPAMEPADLDALLSTFDVPVVSDGPEGRTPPEKPGHQERGHLPRGLGAGTKNLRGLGAGTKNLAFLDARPTPFQRGVLEDFPSFSPEKQLPPPLFTPDDEPVISVCSSPPPVLEVSFSPDETRPVTGSILPPIEMQYTVQDNDQDEIDAAEADRELDAMEGAFARAYRVNRNKKLFREGCKNILSREDRRLLRSLIHDKFAPDTRARLLRIIDRNLRTVRMYEQVSMRLQQAMLSPLKLFTEPL